MTTPTRDYRLGYERAREEAVACLVREGRATTDRDTLQALFRLLVALTGLEPPTDTAAVLGAGEDTDAS